jgi:hypothetical protein
MTQRLNQSRIIDQGPGGIVKLIEETILDGSRAYHIEIGDIYFPCIDERYAMSLFDKLILIEPVDNRARNRIVKSLDNLFASSPFGE